MSVNNLYCSYLFAYSSKMFKCCYKLLECFNNRIIYFNKLLVCTCRLFFCRPVFIGYFLNLCDIISDCKIYSCSLLACTCSRVFYSCKLLVCSCHLSLLGHLRKLSKPICKTHKSALQSKFCKKACIVHPRSGNFSNCLKVALCFG